MRAVNGSREEPAAGARERSERWALTGLALATLLSSLGTSVANVALPTLTTSFGATFASVQWVVLAYLIAITTSIVSAGRLGDISGRRSFLSGGIVLYVAASVLCGFSSALWMLIAARALQGVGAAIMLALSLAFVGDIVPRERTGRAMGLLGTMSAAGTALGPSLGGLLIAGFGWRAIFFVNLPLGAAAFVLARRFLPADRHVPTGDRSGLDSAGALVLGLTLAAYALAVTVGRGGFRPLNAGLLSVAAAGAVIFVLAEGRAKAPLIRMAMFRDPVLGAGFASSTLVSTVMMATMVTGPFYLSRALGLDAAMTGLVLSAGPLVAAMVGVPAGRAVDRLGAQRMTGVGLMGISVGALLLATMPMTAGVPGYVAAIIVITANYALFQTANNTSVLADLEAAQRGVVSGLLNLSRNLGLITGASVMGSIFAGAAGTRDMTAAHPVAIAFGMKVTFGIAAVLIVIALVITQARRSPRPTPSLAAETP